MSELTLKAANEIIAAALATGREMSLKVLAVAVLDDRGALKCFSAEDGTSLRRGEIAIGKATAALNLGLGTRSVNKMAQERPYFMTSLAASIGGPFVPVPGGVLIRNGSAAVIGAVGISGDTSDNDERAAIAGIEAAGLIPDAGAD